MIILLLAAAVSSPPVQSFQQYNLVDGAEHALAAGRIDQAKLMLARAVDAGVSGPPLGHALADLAFASGKNAEAFGRYEALLARSPEDTRLLEPAGIAALKLGDVAHARALLSRAIAAPSASWRAWNALGVAADEKLDWVVADRCFVEASRLAPNEVAPVNNQGWSLLQRGKWSDAAALFERATLLDPKSVRAQNNLELARSALAADLPERRQGEPASSWAARLNDAGVMAALIGKNDRARAAFTRAIEVSNSWYARAATNLEAVGKP